MRVFFLLFFFLGLGYFAFGQREMAVWAQEQNSSLKTEKITILGAKKTSVHLVVELALEPRDQERGLMGRTSLASDRGMLFIFPKADVARFWMRNTLIPLDMVFVNDVGRVVKVHAQAVPYDETFISSPGPVRAVLELAGGQAAVQGIEVGDILTSKTLAEVVAGDKTFRNGKTPLRQKDNPPPVHGVLLPTGVKNP